MSAETAPRRAPTAAKAGGDLSLAPVWAWLRAATRRSRQAGDRAPKKGLSRRSQALALLLGLFCVSVGLRLSDLVAAPQDAARLDTAAIETGTTPGEDGVAERDPLAALAEAALAELGILDPSDDAAETDAAEASDPADRLETADAADPMSLFADDPFAAADRLAAESPTAMPPDFALLETANQSSEARSDSGALFAALRRREAELEALSTELDAREAELDAAARRLEERLIQLDAAKEEFAALLATIDQAARQDVEHLISMYERMKPREAAPLFDSMDPVFAAGFIGRMRADRAAAIMAAMQPDRAYAITLALAGRNARAASPID